MSSKTVPCNLDLSAAQSEQQRMVFRVANLCSGLFRAAGGHISVSYSPALLASRGDCSQAGLLAAAVELRSVLGESPDGRKALNDLGFHPLPECFEGE